MSKYYQNSDLVVNLSHTGSIDKIVLEAMISGCLVLTCNEAFETILDPKYLFKKKDSEGLAQMIIKLKGVEKDKSLKEIVVKYHNLDNLIDKIILGFHV
jgi:glycosyltransferase involved in cell wall biosynthesis